MRLILALTVFISACTAEKENFEWFMGNWVYDIDRTIEFNPEFANLDPVMISQINDTFGNQTWSVRNNLLTYTDSSISIESTTNFEIINESGNRFSLVTEDETLVLTKVGNGFCLSSEIENQNVLVECYKPAGT